MNVKMALAAIKMIAGVKDSKAIKAVEGAAKGDPKSIAALGRVLKDSFGELDGDDLTTIAQAATAERDGGSAFDLPGVSLDTIQEIGMGDAKDYLLDFGAKALSAGARGFADKERLDADALASVLLRRAARRAESPFSQGLLEDKYRAQAAEFNRKKQNAAQWADKAADLTDSVYGRYRADKDYTRGQKMAHINPMSGNRALAEVRQEELTRRLNGKGRK